MKLRLFTIKYRTLFLFATFAYAGTREVFSIPSKNSIVLKGQDPLTINPNKNLPRLNFVRCDSRNYAGFIVTDAAELACRSLKKSVLLRPLKKYPRAYKPRGIESTFEIPGYPYFIFPIDYKGKTYGSNDADFLVINERCELAGALVLTNGKIDPNAEKNLRRRRRKRGLRRTRSFVKKCLINLFDQKVLR